MYYEHRGRQRERRPTERDNHRQQHPRTMKTMNDVSAIKYGFPESRVLLSIKGVTMLSHHMSSSVVALRVSSGDGDYPQVVATASVR